MIKGNIIRLNTLHLNSASMNGVREVQGSSASGGGGIVPNPYIQFADAEVERVLMANGVSSDGIGITIDDAEKVTSIGTWFRDNGLIKSFLELSLFSNLKKIGGDTLGYSAFYSCDQLQSLGFPKNAESIGSYCLYQCNNLSIDISQLPQSIKSIGAFAFQGVTTTGVLDLPNLEGTINWGNSNDVAAKQLEGIENLGAVTSIAGFMKQEKLRYVNIPQTCSDIATNAFSGCDALEQVICRATTPPTLGATVFSGSSCPIYVPDASLEAYKTATNWVSYADRIHPLSEIEGSPYIQFEDAEVERVLMANGVSSDGIGITKEDAANVTSIGSWFKNNKAATSFNEINYFINLEEIGVGAFYNATNLVIDDLNLKNLKKLYYGAFNSTKVRKISSLGNVTSLMDAAASVGGSFQNCDELTEILQEVLDKITDIGNAGFTNCDNLRIDLIMPSLEVIAQGFAKCPIRRILNLGNITQLFGDTMLGYNTYPFGQEYDTMIIPSSVTRIGRYAFAGDGNMKALIVKASTPPSLAQAAFSQSASTCGVYVPDSSVESYKAEWSAWSNRIRPISQFATDNPTLYAEIQQYL